jgi:hypothetical protein
MTAYNLLGAIFAVFVTFLNFILLYSRTERGRRFRARMGRLLRRTTGRPDLGWIEWWHIAGIVALVLGTVMTFDLLTGLYSCPAPGAPSDIGGFLAQGHALWVGSDPFKVPDCGTTILEPDGLAAVLINGIGSLGGVAGIALIWGAISVALVPVTWFAAGPDRRYLTLVVATSPLYLPLVAGQIDGASNALVPLTILLTLYLASRNEVRATLLAGFLATQRFPTLFPVLGMTGSFRRRFSAAAALLVAFAVGTGVAFLIWGPSFLGPVFFDQVNRRSFSLKVWGVLLLNNLVPTGHGLTIGQALLTLLLVGVVFFRVRSPLRAAAITLCGVALLTQFLSFNILVWLLPVALVGVRPRWWLWGIGIIGSINYDYALNLATGPHATLWPTELLDIALTVLLLGLLLDLWRMADTPPPESSATARVTMPTSGKDYAVG